MSKKSKKSKLKERKIIALIAVILVASGFVLYNFIIFERLYKMEQNFISRIDKLEENYTAQIGYLDMRLKNTQNEYQNKMNKLSDAIDALENESKTELDVIRTQIKDINIQSADFSAIVNDVLLGVVSVSTDISQGSGAIITSNGYVVTNYHVIEDASLIRIRTYDKKTYSAEIIGNDLSKDITVLKIDGSFSNLNFGDSSNVKVGEKAIALGNPAGLSFTVTEGIISSFRKIGGTNYIQTDVPINPGNSGGPLVSKEGNIIGINNMKVRGFEALSFAIESNTVKNSVNDILMKNNITFVI